MRIKEKVRREGIIDECLKIIECRGKMWVPLQKKKLLVVGKIINLVLVIPTN